jgi:hypothetical protein
LDSRGATSLISIGPLTVVIYISPKENPILKEENGFCGEFRLKEAKPKIWD